LACQNTSITDHFHTRPTRNSDHIWYYFLRKKATWNISQNYIYDKIKPHEMPVIGRSWSVRIDVLGLCGKDPSVFLVKRQICWESEYKHYYKQKRDRLLSEYVPPFKVLYENFFINHFQRGYPIPLVRNTDTLRTSWASETETIFLWDRYFRVFAKWQ